MKAMVLRTVEAALNRHLKLDPQASQQLQSLAGKSIQVIIPDWQTECYIQLHDNHLTLATSQQRAAHAIIEGKLTELIKLATTKTLDTNNQVRISGEIDTIEQFKQCLQNMKADWQAQLSQITGNTIASQLSSGLKYAIKAKTALRNQLGDYLTKESPYCSSQSEVSTFCHDVDDLAKRVERLSESLNTASGEPAC
jgi:ubiquinone biosynthesis protein UbiJ